MPGENETPAYRVIYDTLKQEAKKAGPDGVRIGSHRELAERFGVGQSTVVRAVNRLKRDGWAYGRQGKGTYLRQRPEPEGVSQITLITPSLDTDTATYSKALNDALDHDRYSLAVSSTHADLNRYQQVISHVGSLRPAGIIILSLPEEVCVVDPQPLVDAGVPVVVIGEAIPGLSCDRVVFSQEDGARKVVRHVLGQGHRDIGLAVYDPSRKEPRDFIAAVRRELAAAGVDLPDDRLFPFSAPHGYSAAPDPYIDATEQMAELLAKGLECKTLIFDHDYPAVGALRAILEAGICVPEEMRLVSGMRCAVEGASPMKLTTVDSHRARQARLAGELLIRRLAGHDGPPEVHHVDGEWVAGETL
ncbi:MAG: GntR family transcriptional regulator [Verrucomicrobiota bacterium]